MVKDKQEETECRRGKFPIQSSSGSAGGGRGSSRKAHLLTWERKRGWGEEEGVGDMGHQEEAMKRTAKSAQRDAGRSWGRKRAEW